MRATGFIVAAALAACGPSDVFADDYVYSDSFEQRVCDGVDCTYCSPLDPLPLCGSHSHCVPQPDASSMCTYPDGSGTQGSTCSTPADCSGPYTCVDTGMVTTKCRHWCNRSSGGTECASLAGTTCVGFGSALYTGGTEWGVCL